MKETSVGHRRITNDLRADKRREAVGLQARVRCVSAALREDAAGPPGAWAEENQARTACQAVAGGPAPPDAALLARVPSLLPSWALMGRRGICRVLYGAPDCNSAHPEQSLAGARQKDLAYRGDTV